MKIVILHGWGQNKEHWQQLVSNLQDFKPVIFDLPGFGTEKLVSPDWGIPEYAEWVEKKLSSLELNQDVVLLGHSFGGRIASYLAASRPSWLKALILYGAPSIYRPSTRTRLRIRLYKILKKLGLRGRSTNEELNAADQIGLGKIFRNVVVFDQTQLLPNINVPTLLVWGETDEPVPLHIAQEISCLIPSSKLVVLDKVGHNAHLENPSLFYGTIKKFLENL